MRWLPRLDSGWYLVRTSITSGLSWIPCWVQEKRLIEFFTLRKHSSSFKSLQLRSISSGGRTHVHGVEKLLH